MTSVSGTFECVFRGNPDSLRGIVLHAYCVWTRVAFWPLVLWWCHARGPAFRRFVSIAFLWDFVRTWRCLSGEPMPTRATGYADYLAAREAA